MRSSQRVRDRLSQSGTSPQALTLSSHALHVLPPLAACVSEAFKLLTFASQTMNNYLMYMGQEGVYTLLTEYERKHDCAACAPNPTHEIALSRASTLRELVDRLLAEPTLQMAAPTLGLPGRILFCPKPKGSLAALVDSNLARSLVELAIDEDDDIVVTDEALPAGRALHLKIKYTD